MRTIEDMLNSAKKVDLRFLLENALVDSQADYVKLQKDQMLHGLNRDNEKIGIYKSAAYADYKFEKNSLAGKGTPDLKLTGAFYSGIFADARSEGIVVDSLDSKTDDLLHKYSEKIFGLGPVRIVAFRSVVHPKVINQTVNTLNK